MNVFIQGMRRNGTTIFFDLFCEDGSFACYYEPLAAASKPCIGGGSQVRDSDYFQAIRSVRNRLLQDQPQLRYESFNYGAPRDATLEFEPDVPEHILNYLHQMCGGGRQTVIKFTRMARKVTVLSQVDSKALFLHVVRDPRRVVASYLFGKNGKYRERFSSEQAFFGSSLNRLPWSASQFSDCLLRDPAFKHVREAPDFLRILLVWKDCFDSAWREGHRCFGERYLLVRHEDLLSNPEGVLTRIYGTMGKPVPGHVLEWAGRNLRSAREVFSPDHVCWRQAFEAIDLYPSLRTAGYLAPQKGGS